MRMFSKKIRKSVPAIAMVTAISAIAVLVDLLAFAIVGDKLWAIMLTALLFVTLASFTTPREGSHRMRSASSRGGARA